MTAEFESLAGLLLVILAVTCVVQVILVGLLLWYVRRMAELLAGSRAGAVSSAAPWAGPAPSPVPGAEGAVAVPPVPEAPGAPPVPGAEILGDSPDIQESIRRLCGKYSLSDFIISTMDGLVVVSLSPGSSEEAARFSDLYRRKRRPDSPGVSFLEISHRGEAMLAIARSDRPLDPGRLRAIGEDARKILDWWL